MNVIAQLEYELVYYDSAVHRFNHYTTRTPSWGAFDNHTVKGLKQKWYILSIYCIFFFFCKFYLYIINQLFHIFAMWNIIINLMLCHQHGYPWPSLATSPYHSSPLAGLQGYILCLHIAAVCKLVILLLIGHIWGSIRVHHLWACPCFSSSVLRVWFV